MMPQEEEVQARHILVATEEKAKELAEAIGKGGDFAQLAKDNSSDPGSKDNGGMLGYFGKGQMVPEFEKAAFELKAGELSKPVKSQFGWHIIKVDDRRQKKPPTFEEVKDRLLGSMAQNKAQEIASNLRGKATIEYVDPEIRKQAEEDAIKAAVQKKQMEEQIKKMEQQGKQ
jgi:peptidyl-prolyl cis-trans isomerase C